MSTRLSIASLVRKLIRRDTGEAAYIGFANKGSFLKKKELLFTAPAGGTLAWPAGERYLIDEWGADFKGADREDGGIDLRFWVDDDRVERVLDLFVFPDVRLYESPLACIIREVGGELTTAEIKGLQDSPVLDPGMLPDLSYRPLRTYRQPLPDDGVGTSANSAARRLFYMFDMEVSGPVWEILRQSPLIRFFTEAEVALTNGGRRKAKVGDATIGDNIFVLPE